MITTLCIISFTFIPDVEANSNPNNSIFISEINYAGSTNPSNCKKILSARISCSSDKWVEIYNPGTQSVSLKGWKIGVGQRKNDPSLFASTFYLPNIGIKPKEAVVFANKNKNLTSTLDLANINYQVSGSLFGISNNTSGQKYLRVALINDEKIVSERNIQNLDVIEKENNISQTKESKHTIIYDSSNSDPKFSLESTYYPLNFGNPGLFYITVPQKPTTTVQTISEKSLKIPVEDNPAKITEPDNNKPSIEEVDKIAKTYPSAATNTIIQTTQTVVEPQPATKPVIKEQQITKKVLKPEIFTVEVKKPNYQLINNTFAEISNSYKNLTNLSSESNVNNPSKLLLKPIHSNTRQLKIPPRYNLELVIIISLIANLFRQSNQYLIQKITYFNLGKSFSYN